MFKLIRKAKEVRLFFEGAKIYELCNDKLIDIYENKEFRLHYEYTSTVQLIIDSFAFVFKVDKNGRKDLYNTGFVKSFKTEKDANCILKYPYIFSLTFNEELTEEFFRVYDIEKEEYLLKSEGAFSDISFYKGEFFIISTLFKKLTSYSFSDFHPLWHYSLPEGKYDTEDTYSKQLFKGEIQRIIGVYEGILWVSLDRGNLLGLSAKEGHLIYDLAVPINFAEHFPDKAPRFGANYTQLDESRGVLFGMRLQYYWEINLQNPSQEYFLYDISSTCAETQTDASILEFETWLGDEVGF